MQVVLKNDQLSKAASLLFALTLKGKQSRMRTKFLKLVNKRLEEVAEEEQNLLKEFCHLDDNGNPKQKPADNGGEMMVWDYKDEEEFAKEYKDFRNEKNTFGGGDADSMLRIVGEVLFDCDIEFSGSDADFYDELCDIFEAAIDNESPAEDEAHIGQ